MAALMALTGAVFCGPLVIVLLEADVVGSSPRRGCAQALSAPSMCDEERHRPCASRWDRLQQGARLEHEVSMRGGVWAGGFLGALWR